jgi:HEAT repeat protein
MIAGSPIAASLTVAIFLAIFTTASAAVAQADAPPDLPASLLKIITSNTAIDTRRQDAAVELVGLDSPAARALVSRGLAKNSSPEGRIALMGAIASASAPDINWIDPLGSLLGNNVSQTRAAAQALANYRGNDHAFALMRDFADSPANPTAPREDTIRAMGTLIDKEPAQWLVNVVGNAAANALIRDAAADALTEMSGHTFGTNGKKWQQWFATAAGKTPEQFHALLLEGRGREAAQLRQLKDAAAALLRDFYSNAPDDARKSEIVLKYLGSDSPVIRLAAVDLVNKNIVLHPPAQEVKDRLVEMIGDGDEAVRQRVIDGLRDSTRHDDYPKLLDKLIQRLAVENSPQVKIKIATAIGKFGLPAAGDAILQLLKDPDQAVATSAANALSGNLGHNLQDNNKKTADAIAGVLRGIINGNAGRPGTDELRGACVGALEALQGPAAFDDLMKLVVQGETPEVRKAALQGLADIGNNDAMDRIAGILDERDPVIRLEAARAMGPVAMPVDNQKFFVRITNERDPDVAQALWTSLQKLYDKLPPADLVTWADRFNNPPLKDPDKWLVTLVKLGDAYKAANDPRKVAENQQDIAHAMMEVTPPQIAGAIKNLSEALKYWRDSGNGNESVLNGVVGDLLTDKLKAGLYADATQFAAEQIKALPANQEIVGPPIMNEADRLRRTGNPADKAAAKTLISEALKMNPPLRENTRLNLEQIQADMDRQ